MGVPWVFLRDPLAKPLKAFAKTVLVHPERVFFWTSKNLDDRPLHSTLKPFVYLTSLTVRDGLLVHQVLTTLRFKFQ